MKRIKANIIFTEPCLGTASADPELHSRFIASNAPDALTRQEQNNGKWVSVGMQYYPDCVDWQK